VELAHAEHSAVFGERLGSGRQADGVRADHPGAVYGDAAAPGCGEPEDQAGHHRGPEHEPQDVQQLTVPSPPLPTNESSDLLATVIVIRPSQTGGA